MRPRPDHWIRQSSTWQRFVDGVTFAGLVCVGIEWGWQGLAFAVGTATAFGLTVLGSVASGYDRPTGARAGRCAVHVALFASAVVGLVAALDVIALCVLLGLAVTAPPVTEAFGRTFVAPEAVTQPDTQDVAVTKPDLAGLDDDALCLAWRRSYLRFADAASPAEILAVVLQRQWLLDELHRRSSQGVSAWFAAGGRASGNPLPYLSADRSQADPGTGT